jgi:HlyD family secretion protein
MQISNWRLQLRPWPAVAAAIWLVPLFSWTTCQASAAGLNAAQAIAMPVVTVMLASRQQVVRTVTVIGSLVPREDVLVGVDLNGYLLTAIAAEEGDRIKAGQVLARLATDMLEAQRAEKSASVMRYDAAINQARSLIAQMQSEEIQTAAALGRAETLFKSGSATQDILDQRLASAASAKAKLESAKQGLSLAQADKLLAEAQLRQTEIEIAKTEIRALTDGTILSRAAQIGQLVSSGSGALFHIARDGTIELAANVVESSLAEITAGQAVKVHVQGVADPIVGEVRLVSPEVDKTTKLGKLRIALQGNSDLKTGSFARAEIEVGRHQSIVVPPSAVFSGDAYASVMVAVSGKVETRKVVLGARDSKGVEIIKGVEVGDAIVLRAGTFLNDGDEVTPMLVAYASQQG